MNSGKHGLAAPILHSTQLVHVIPGFVKVFGPIEFKTFPRLFFKTNISFFRALPNYPPTRHLSIPSLALSPLPITFNPFSPALPDTMPTYHHPLTPALSSPYLMRYHPPMTCLTITLPCLTTPNTYPLSFSPCFTSPYAHALQYFYPLPYHSLLLYLTNSFPLPYHTLRSFFALLSPTPPSYTTVLTNYLDSFVIWCCQKWLAITREVHTSYSCCVSLEHGTFSFTLDNEKVSRL